MRIDSSFFADNRKALVDRIGKDAAAVLFAGNSRRMSQDSEYRFLVDRDFYYLTGVEVEDCRLILKGSGECTLFVPARDSKAERWHGKRMDLSEYTKISGIEDIRPVEDYEEAFFGVKREMRICYDGQSISDAAAAFVKANPEGTDISSILVKMRMVKRKPEIDAIIEAGKITSAALREMRSAIAAGASELDLYSVLESGLMKRGSLLQAFPTIVSIDGNSFYLHHSEPEPDKAMQKGSFVQIDVGARCCGYCADISRVFVLGAGSGKDRILLDLIRKLRAEAFSFIAPGVTFASLNERMKSICAEFMEEHGLPGEPSDYYWHNTSHHLGLDVHDVCDKTMPFEPGNCLAVEPGVYIEPWGVGFRIEDDVLVTEDGCTMLTEPGDSDEYIYTEEAT